MTNVYPDVDEDDSAAEDKRAVDLDANAVPEPVAVYDRPESADRQGLTLSPLLIGILLIVLAVVTTYVIFF